jgi:hypothetical protein
MLVSLLPRSAHRYLSLPLFGPVVDDFDDWLLERGYTRGSRHFYFPTVVHIRAALSFSSALRTVVLRQISS